MGILAVLKWFAFTPLGRLASAAIIIAILYGIAKAAWDGYKETKEEVGRVTQQLEQKKKDYAKLGAKHNKYKQDVHAQILNERKLQNDLRDDMQYLMERNHELSNLLSKHDLNHLTEIKPGLIELRVNRATKRVLVELERATGGSGGGASPGTTD